ncbi:putative lipoprotein [Synechococcus sp. WH 8103]|nr:putative lipoprotein [Synechococcus sp. WH 8103]
MVSRPFSQGSLTSAGNPSTLCSSGGSPSMRAASSGAPVSPACSRAAARGWAGSLAAHPRQAIGSDAVIGSLLRNPAMKRLSIRRFHCQSHPEGPSCQRPQRAQARPC